MPPACAKPGSDGGIRCVASGPRIAPPWVLRSASRSIPASTARRTFMSSNGAIAVFSGM